MPDLGRIQARRHLSEGIAGLIFAIRFGFYDPGLRGYPKPYAVMPGRVRRARSAADRDPVPEPAMVNLLDIMRQAQHGAGMDNMARQFGLSLGDAQRAVETLLPAFSLGFRRNAMNPGAFAPFLDALSSGRYAPFFDGTTLVPGGVTPPGAELMGQIFGSPEVTRQIAQQASAMSGVGAQVLQRIMPTMGAVLMGGMTRHASLEGVSDVLRQWADWLKVAASAQTARAQPASPDLYGTWTGLVGSMFGMASELAPAKPALAPAGPTDPWAQLMATMTGGWTKPEPPPPPPPAQPNAFSALAQMFEAGREVQAQHLAQFQQILDGMWGVGRTR